MRRLTATTITLGLGLALLGAGRLATAQTILCQSTGTGATLCQPVGGQVDTLSIPGSNEGLNALGYFLGREVFGGRQGEEQTLRAWEQQTGQTCLRFRDALICK
jgi:hypothetical protein